MWSLLSVVALHIDQMILCLQSTVNQQGLLADKKREGRCFGVYFGKCKSRAILQFVLFKGCAVYNNQ